MIYGKDGSEPSFFPLSWDHRQRKIGWERTSVGTWFEVIVKIHRECEDAVGEILANFGAKGYSVEDPHLASDPDVRWTGDYWPDVVDDGMIVVKAYFPQNLLEEQWKQLQNQVAALADFGLKVGAWEVTRRAVAEEDWAHAWKDYYHTEVFDRVVVKPLWEEYEPKEGQLVIVMDPGMAFGTGGHPTTSMCLRALQTFPIAGKVVWDIGTGSGILACAAGQMGADNIVACDIDPTATASARINAERNGVVAHVMEGTIEDLLGTADVIIANIIADVIVPMAPIAAEKLNPQGWFLASGIIENRIDDVRGALSAASLNIIEEWHQGEWYCVLSRKG